MPKEKAQLRLLTLISKQPSITKEVKILIMESFMIFNESLSSILEDEKLTDMEFTQKVLNMSEDVYGATLKSIAAKMSNFPDSIMKVLHDELPEEFKVADKERTNKLQESILKSMGLTNKDLEIPELPVPVAKSDQEVN